MPAETNVRKETSRAALWSGENGVLSRVRWKCRVVVETASPGNNVVYRRRGTERRMNRSGRRGTGSNVVVDEGSVVFIQLVDNSSARPKGSQIFYVDEEYCLFVREFVKLSSLGKFWK